VRDRRVMAMRSGISSFTMRIPIGPEVAHFGGRDKPVDRGFRGATGGVLASGGTVDLTESFFGRVVHWDTLPLLDFTALLFYTRT